MVGTVEKTEGAPHEPRRGWLKNSPLCQEHYAEAILGSRILDVADLRQYIYEQMGRIRTNAFLIDGLYGNDIGKKRSRRESAS